eukprot:scaffold575827_cov33-Prasinocladus_malaysianus.AAC.1
MSILERYKRELVRQAGGVDGLVSTADPDRLQHVIDVCIENSADLDPATRRVLVEATIQLEGQMP